MAHALTTTVHADLTAWAREWRSAMVRFAQLHIQPKEEAEDAVQDALAALLAVRPDALKGVEPRRYLFGILKHKITDRLRERYRQAPMDSGDIHDKALDDTLFDAQGHWAEGVAPTQWHTPDDHVQNQQFFIVVDLCVNRLPRKPAQVFSMKAFLECETEEICVTLGLSKTDYWQCMSRARKQLQLCLTQHWFETEPGSKTPHRRESRT